MHPFPLRALLFGMTAAAVVLGLAHPSAALAQATPEPAPTSRLTGIPLAGSAQRLTNQEALAQITSRLEALAARAQKRSAFPEVLVWPGKAAAAATIISAVEAALKKAGYTYEARNLPAGGGVETRVLAVEKPGKQVAGLWMVTAEYVALGWCQLLDPKLDAVSSSPVPVPDNRVLVTGKPPLTQAMVSRFHRFTEWVLDAPLTGEQRQQLEAATVEAWKSKNQAQMETVLQLLKLNDQVMALPEENRSLLLAQAQPEFLRTWRQQTTDTTARWLVSIYDAAHQPIAPGNPPLTRQVCDAYAELVAFLVSEVTGKPCQASREQKEASAKALTANYGKLSADQRLQLSRIPMVWAALRTAWPKALEAERAGLRCQWAELLKKLAPEPQVSARGGKAMQELEALAPRIRSGEITPPERRSAADRMEIVAAELRRQQAQSSVSGKKALSSQQAYDHLMAIQRQQHNAYVSM